MRSVLTIGNFDGVHLGHRAILQRCREVADAEGGQVVALTFDPPPIVVLGGRPAPPAICPVDQRVAQLRSAGADAVEVLQPTPEMLGQPPEQFVEALVQRHAPAAIIEGADFRFGKGRAGDMQTLDRLGQTHGFAVHTVAEVTTQLSHGVAAPVRSTLVRTLIGQGRLLDAAACLARPFTVSAPVVHGERRGRTVDIPTANLDPAHWQKQIVPPDGVYAGCAQLPDGRRFAAAISLGPKPTFAGRALTLEAHLLGYAPADPDELYGQPIALSFARWLRDQYPFPSVVALVDQLRRDIDRIGRWHEAGLLNPQRTAA